MTTYSIKDLESISGIKAHTLRIWEKRYNLLSPERSSTNIRRYGDDDLRRLLNISTLIENGWKISKASGLTEKERSGEIEKLLDSVELQDGKFTPHVNALVLAMMEFDEAGFEKVYSLASLMLGLKSAMIHIIYPFLIKIGLMWTVWKSNPGQEHFASNIIRKKLFSAIDHLSVSQSKNETFLLFLPEGEDHEISLLFSYYLLRSEGFKTVYLGQNLPFESLEIVAEVCKPDHLLTFFITKSSKAKLSNYVDKLASSFPETTIFIAGNEISLDIDPTPVGVNFLNKPSDLLDIIERTPS